MNLDWTFLARNLASHLVAAGDTDATERILDDARQHAARLAAPADFWARVANEYEKQAWHLGLERAEHIRATLLRFRDGEG